MLRWPGTVRWRAVLFVVFVLFVLFVLFVVFVVFVLFVVFVVFVLFVVFVVFVLFPARCAGFPPGKNRVWPMFDTGGGRMLWW